MSKYTYYLKYKEKYKQTLERYKIDLTYEHYKDNKIPYFCPVHKEVVYTNKVGLYRRRPCKLCSKEAAIRKKTKITEDFIREAKVFHGDRYDYSKSIYKGALDKLIIICPKHGEFLQLPTSHTRNGNGCPTCNFEELHGAKVKSFNWFLTKAREVHGDRYTYVEESYVKTKQKMTVVCQEHGAFQQTPCNHLKGSGCRKCSDRDRGEKKRITADQYKDKIIALFGGDYDLSKLNYYFGVKDITLTCKKHGEFTRSSEVLLKGHGCPKCTQGGFDRAKPTTFYLVRWIGFCDEFLKFGVTNRTTEDRVKKQASKAKLDYEILHEFRFEDGNIPWQIETWCKTSFDTAICPPTWLPDGYTETVSMDHLPEILAHISTYNNTNLV
jgi:hypothetical protein